MLRMESFKHNIRLGFFKDSIPFFLVFGNIKKRKKEKKRVKWKRYSRFPKVLYQIDFFKS